MRFISQLRYFNADWFRTRIIKLNLEPISIVKIKYIKANREHKFGFKTIKRKKNLRTNKYVVNKIKIKQINK